MKASRNPAHAATAQMCFAGVIGLPGDTVEMTRAVTMAAVVLGSRVSARVAPRFLYDAQGSALYAAICQLDEYYPPRVTHESVPRPKQP